MNKSVFKVFYLIGGYKNFVCQSVVGIFSFEEAEKQAKELRLLGYRSLPVKNGNIIGGLCSFDEFKNDEERKKYFYSIP